MAKNSKPVQKPVAKAPEKKSTSTPVRNSPIPKAAPAAKPAPVAAKPAPAPAAKPAPAPAPAPAKPVSSAPAKNITHDAIAKRAYEIHQSGKGGSEQDNWHRAERELRGH